MGVKRAGELVTAGGSQMSKVSRRANFTFIEVLAISRILALHVGHAAGFPEKRHKRLARKDVRIDLRRGVLRIVRTGND